MKTIFTSLIISFMFMQTLSAQLIAGTVPAGRSTYNPNIHLSASTTGQESKMGFDVDCDSIPDMSVAIVKGFPAADIPNTVNLYVLDTSFQVCKGYDSTLYQFAYYSYGDTLDCTGFHSWKSDSVYYIGSWGSFLVYGPDTIADKYITFRNSVTGQTGWIKLSFDIRDIPVITLSVTEVLLTCNITALQPLAGNPAFQSHPNPTADGKIQFHCSEKIEHGEVINSTGQIVGIIKDGDEEITLPEQKGIYLLTISGKQGGFYREKVVRQ